MSLLVLDGVSKRLRQGRADVRVLTNVAMLIESGELVAVRGARRSGRTTLLQVASGLLVPDAGRVLFAGRDMSLGVRLGREIAWAKPMFDAALGRSMTEQVGYPLLVDRPRAQATRAASRMLEEVGAAEIADLPPARCQPHELLLASIARAMVTAPRLLLLDEPVAGLNSELSARVLDLLRAFALDGTAVLFTEDRAVLGVDRTLTIDAGQVRGNAEPPAAPVIPIRGVSA